MSRNERATQAAWSLLWLVVVMAGFFVLQKVDRWLHLLPPCPLHRLTGFPCPTCGSTRAALALSHGEWVEALATSPLLVLLVAASLFAALLYVIAACTGRRLRRPWHAWEMQHGRRVVLVLLGSNWLYLWVRELLGRGVN